MWIIGGEYILTEICSAFTIVTVINSYMMISGMDTPKTGRFAYIHLMIRLAIISLICFIIERESIFQAIKRRVTEIKNIEGTSNKIKKIYKNVLKNKYNSICIIYTLTIVITCLVMAATFFYQPKGGEGLYFNLVLLFIFIFVIVMSLYIFKIIKSLLKRNQKV